jgi:hypothetical protein
MEAIFQKPETTIMERLKVNNAEHGSACMAVSLAAQPAVHLAAQQTGPCRWGGHMSRASDQRYSLLGGAYVSGASVLAASGTYLLD